MRKISSTCEVLTLSRREEERRGGTSDERSYNISHGRWQTGKILTKVLQVDYLWMVVLQRISMSLALSLYTAMNHVVGMFWFCQSASSPLSGGRLPSFLLGNLCSPNVHGLGGSIDWVLCSPKSKRGFGTQARPVGSVPGIYKNSVGAPSADL